MFHSVACRVELCALHYELVILVELCALHYELVILKDDPFCNRSAAVKRYR